MTAAQKIAKEKFKKAIAYRQKTGCTLKEAFASVYGKKTAAKKTAVKKSAVKKSVGDFNKNKAQFIEAKKPVKPRKKRKKSASVWSVKRNARGRFVKRGIKNIEKASYTEKVAGIGAVNKGILNDFEKASVKIASCENNINKMTNASKEKNLTTYEKQFLKKAILISKKYLSELKKQKSELKKLL